MTKRCKTCGAEGGDDLFYVSMRTKCKECHRASVKQNRQDNAEYYKAYDAQRYQSDPRVKARHRRYQQTHAGKASLSRSRVKWLAGNAEKRAAHIILGNAVRDGRLDKPDECSVCGAGGRIHGHHDDYARPLDVVWCCPTCHTAIHRNGDQQ